MGTAIDKTGNTTPVWNPVNYTFIQKHQENHIQHHLVFLRY